MQVPQSAPEAAFDWRTLLGAYGWDSERAYAIMMCESSGNPLAHNSAGHVGLFQVSPIHRWTRAELENPEINVAAAYELYQRNGWQPWPNCP
jgi:soluble lytic murein transglycosylase-like protein